MDKPANPEYDVENAEGIIIEELTNTQVEVSSVGSTYRTANIKMIDDRIEKFINHYGQETPFLIVARASLDGNEYAAIFDVTTMSGYVVGVTRVNGIIKELRDLDGLFQDEEWAVMNEFFQQHKVFEINRIWSWTWNTMMTPKLQTGMPKHMLENWGLDPETWKRRR